MNQTPLIVSKTQLKSDYDMNIFYTQEAVDLIP